MKKLVAVLPWLLLASCGGPGPGTTAPQAAAAPALPSGPGWTATTHPQDIIAARQELMTRIEQLMISIDGLQVNVKADPKMLREHAEGIGSMLAAVPHLFPPNTNLYDPKAEQPVTLAMPAIWQNFDGFYALAGAAVTAAHTMATAEGKDAQRKASLALRATCDACHAQNLRPYKPSTVQPSDRDLDVDSLLK